MLGSKINILIVEDSEINQKIVQRKLKNLGLYYLVAFSGEEALSLASKHTIDLVLMDIFLPGINGIETMQKMKEMMGFKDCKFVALSANMDPASVEKYLEAGMDDCLDKTFSIEDFLNMIQRFLNKRQKNEIDH